VYRCSSVPIRTLFQLWRNILILADFPEIFQTYYSFFFIHFLLLSQYSMNSWIHIYFFSLSFTCLSLRPFFPLTFLLHKLAESLRSPFIVNKKWKIHTKSFVLFSILKYTLLAYWQNKQLSWGRNVFSREFYISN
jgi:hypothetical protein